MGSIATSGRVAPIGGRQRTRIAIVGPGRLGHACASAAQDAQDVQLIGWVCRAGSTPTVQAPHARHASQIPHVEHIRELGAVDVALLCVPPDPAAAVAGALLQGGTAIVECARLEGARRHDYTERLDEWARRHRVPGVLGAGWDPGVLQVMEELFAVLIPRGRTDRSDRPGASLHHTAAAERIPGVKAALATERRDSAGRMQRYVYVELVQGTRIDDVQAALEADPAFIDEQTLAFAVDSVAALEEVGQGLVLDRRGVSASGAHPSLLLEGRFDRYIFAARVMIDAARWVRRLAPGAHRYAACLAARGSSG